MASSHDAEKKANRLAALSDLKYKRANQANQSSSSSSRPIQQPPSQSRDASGAVSSRFFSTTPSSSSSSYGNVLVPSSSPLGSPQHHNQGISRLFTPHAPADVARNAGRGLSNPWGLEQHSPGHDPSTASSGFYRSNANGNSIRPPLSRSYNDTSSSSLKRPNSTTSLNAVLPLQPDSPASPLIQRAGKRRKLNGLFDGGSTSSDESLPENPIATAPSRPRIVRRVEDEHHQRPASTPADPFSDQRFKMFKMTQPTESETRIKAAWLQGEQNASKATQLLLDPRWTPSTNTTTSTSPRKPEERGRVEAFMEANKRQRIAVKEKGKKSMIYANRVDLSSADTQAQTQTQAAAAATPSKSDVIDLTASPASAVVRPPKKRIKKMVLESESEPEIVSSDEEDEDESRRKRSKQENTVEGQALNFFNTKGIEALQELTGCTSDQAQTIVSQRPFRSVDDLNERLGQGKKKAGPAGISPRMFEDCIDIFNGYDIVDTVLEDCEQIGAELRSSIASWSTGSSEVEDGALSLRDLKKGQAKGKGYMDRQPELLSEGVTLKDYQLMGVNWLHLLYKSNLSCILADEMGLGKTIQVISFFACLKQYGNKGPHLVVVPSSTLENWCREFARFAPTVSVQTYYAGKEERVELRQTLLDTQRSKRDDGKGWDVLITTYNLAQGDGDRKFFRRIEWDRYQALLRVESKWRLLLTGTPLQNNLQELVSLMNFILPGQFADALSELRAIFKVKGDSKVSLLAQERVSRAKKMMTPFVLRRRKDQVSVLSSLFPVAKSDSLTRLKVLNDLPKKSERIEWCETTQRQKSLYKDTLQRSRKTIIEAAEAADSSDQGKSKTKATKTKPKPKPRQKQYAENSANVLMDLRKAALHPMLFRSRFTDDTLAGIAKQLLKEPDFKKRGAVFDIVKEDMEVMTDAELQYFCGTYKSTRKYMQPTDCFLDSGKVKTLLRLLREYEEQGRKVLIFSQFTQVLDILEVILKERSTKYLVLTGSTPVDIRQSLVDEFTEDEAIGVFLLSTKAGGMGINLTAASVVIMFDQDFNPHNDRQAQDRAYRIGQKRDVDVVKLITRGTIEEDILKLGEMKLALDEAVAGDTDEGGGETERVVKTSLMRSLREQLIDEAEEGEGEMKVDS
ncbi:DNA-dependent ATPase fun30 [Marasmius crinis-equi]|uniref:DNA-dependent ATPase fun30 n=1 Tax=Marasmius crinis-equi TaxID=585013 RepID=A0ABR3FQ75_9AGAR